MSQTDAAERFTWLISNFVSETPGVEHAIVVSSDGVLMAASRGFPEQHAEQLSAIVSGFQALVTNTAKIFTKGEPEQLILRMQHGHLFAMAISDGSVLAVLTSHEADTRIVAHQMTLLVESVGHALTPQLRKALLPGA